MKVESLDTSYLARPDGAGPFPGVVVVHEASGLNDNIRDICGRFAGEGYAALGVDLFAGRSRAACMARMFAGAMAGNLDYYGVPALKAAVLSRYRFMLVVYGADHAGRVRTALTTGPSDPGFPAI